MILGLTSVKAKLSLVKYGLNKLPDEKGTSSLKVLLRQLQNPLSYLLCGAIILSAAIGDVPDSFLIGAILILNTILGFWQEYKASKELEVLGKLQVEYARVIRDGKQIEIPSTELVPEDAVVLEAGDRIPADGRILESYSLQVNESILTGESLPIPKSTKKEENLVFFGTTAASGRGVFEVLQRGADTKFGSIAESLAGIEEEQTPFEKTLVHLSKGVGIGALLAAVIIFILGVLQGYDIPQMFLTSIALMVAVVPEGLPAVVTIVLALGVRKMYRKKALVRKMIAVESLGSVTVICTDKTGTLTKNEMRVQEVSAQGSKDDLLKCAVLCNSASLVLKEDEGGFDILGDTTEGALLVWAKDFIDIDLVRSEGKLVEEIPFSLESRKMTVFWQQGNQKSAFTKGAPEVLLAQILTEKEREKWDKKYQKMAGTGLRVLAFSKNNEFLGLIGIADEVREEVKEALKLTKQAGIKVVMVTGDNELTAKAVGEEIGLLQKGDELLTGAQLNSLSEEDLLKRIKKVTIFARITPADKLRIVKAYQVLEEVVAVTGDGVNDALALKQAEVGVSMGKTGTDTSKEASDIVLLDDNFATLVTAVEQGRLIYSNILKVVKFLLTGNLSELFLIVLGVAFGLPSPLLPIQILWINFVTDGPPALALGFDSPSSHLMQTRPGNQALLSKDSLRFIICGGMIISAFCLTAFYLTFKTMGLQTSRSVTFTLMVILQMMLPFIMRRHHGILSNKKLFAAIAVILVIQLLIITLPPLKMLFKV